MKSLERLINANLNQLDFHEPPDGHFMRFQNKLGALKSTKRIAFLRIAVSLFFVIAFSLTFLLLSPSGNTSNLPIELKETAFFYDKQSECLKIEIQKSTVLTDSEKHNLLKDVSNFEKEYPAILNELAKFPKDDRLIEAFINYHKSRSEFLKNILNQINGTYLTTI